jgi:hypothetical protein
VLARDLGERLGWKTWIPSLDDATPQTGKVTQRSANGGVKQVEFLSGVIGLTKNVLAAPSKWTSAWDIAAVRVFLFFGIDPLLAIPLEAFKSRALHRERWPRIVREIGDKRAAAAAIAPPRRRRRRPTSDR